MTDHSHHHPLVPPRRFQWAPLVSAIITFLAGAVIGAGLYKWLVPPVERARPKTTEERAERWMREIDDRVGLTSQQEDKVRRLTLSATREYQEIRNSWRMDMERVILTFQNQMQLVLTSEQKPKFDEYYRELLERWLPKPTTQPATQPGNG